MAYRLLLLGLLTASVLYIVAARSIPMDPWTAAEAINAQTLPTVYGVLLSAALIIALWRTRPASGTAIPPGRQLRLAGIAALVLAFTALIGWLNLWLALAGLLLGATWWLGERRWLPLLALATVVPLLGFLGIEVGLGLYLPD